MISTLPGLRSYVDAHLLDAQLSRPQLHTLPSLLDDDHLAGILQQLQHPGLTISRTALDMQVQHEIVSEAYYNHHLTRPYWPGGASGVTVGIGYDLGYHSREEIIRDWRDHLDAARVRTLAELSGLRGARAKDKAWVAHHVVISIRDAEQVYVRRSLPKYAAQTLRFAPNVRALPPDAQGAMLSLIYNRGASVTGNTRREMAVIQQLIASLSVGARMIHVLGAISDEILSMIRLWEGKGLSGLIRRRHDEAAFMLSSLRRYHRDELILID